MTRTVLFRTERLSGCAPDDDAAALYATLFGHEQGATELARDLHDWTRHKVSPWSLFHAGRPVAVAGFRIGFGENGLELRFHFVPDVWGQGLASEFVQAALDHAQSELKEHCFFARVEPAHTPSLRILEKAGFVHDPSVTTAYLMRLDTRA